MTLPEALGSLGGLIVAIVAPITAYVLGYGGLVVLAAVPVGFLLGWMLGVAVTPVVDARLFREHQRHAAPLERPELASDEED